MKSSKKEMKKRLLALLLCITMVLNGGISTFAEETKQPVHEHTEECKTLVKTDKLICTKPEVEETAAHKHTDDACYEITCDKELTCELEATEGHSHGEDCYAREKKLICEEAEHEHSDACYVEESKLTCELKEVPAHTHGEECFTLTETKTQICELEEAEAHTHGDDCYEWIEELSCEFKDTKQIRTADKPQCKCGNEECTCTTCEEGCTCTPEETTCKCGNADCTCTTCEEGCTCTPEETTCKCGNAECTCTTCEEGCTCTPEETTCKCGNAECTCTTCEEGCTCETEETTCKCGNVNCTCENCEEGCTCESVNAIKDGDSVACDICEKEICECGDVLTAEVREAEDALADRITVKGPWASRKTMEVELKNNDPDVLAALKAASPGYKVKSYLAYDFNFEDKTVETEETDDVDSQNVERTPVNNKVKVTITFGASKEVDVDKETLKVVHLAESTSDEGTPTIAPEEVDAEFKFNEDSTGVTGVEFFADSFSVYAIVWAIDNGAEIPGEFVDSEGNSIEGVEKPLIELSGDGAEVSFETFKELKITLDEGTGKTTVTYPLTKIQLVSNLEEVAGLEIEKLKYDAVNESASYLAKDATDWVTVDETLYKLRFVYETPVTAKVLTLTAALANGRNNNLEKIEVELKTSGEEITIEKLVKDGVIPASYTIDGKEYKFRDAIWVKTWTGTNGFTCYTYKKATKNETTAKMVYGLKLNGTTVQFRNSDNSFLNLGSGTIALMYAEDLQTVDTIDSKALGVTMRMVNFKNVQKDFGGTYAENVGRTKGLLTNKVGKNGYPSTTQLGNENFSFEKWFGPDAATRSDKDPNVATIQEANHLFLKEYYDESGTFHYSGFENYASMDKSGQFTVYEEIGASDAISTSYSHQRGHFLPYNTIAPGIYSSNKNMYDPMGNKLSENDSRYKEDLYVTKEAVDYNFGMYLEAEFAQPNNGIYRNAPMVFEFNGDDDFWVYLDGVLVLDIGGIHNAQSGYINFATGEVVVKKLPLGTGTNTTIKQMFVEALGQEGLGEYEFKGDTFADGSIHKMQVFYMERGKSASNLHLNFNLPTVPSGLIQVEKLLGNTDQEAYTNLPFSFRVWAQKIIKREDALDENGNRVQIEEYAEDKYVVLDADSGAYVGNENNKLTFLEDGTFTLKPTEIATFPNIQANRKYYVEEVNLAELQKDNLIDVYQTRYIENGKTKVGESTVDENGVIDTVKTTSLAASVRKKATFVNYVQDAVLGNIQIEKKIMNGNPNPEYGFNFKVTVQNNVTENMEPYVGDYYLKDANDNYLDSKGNPQILAEGTLPAAYGRTYNGVIPNVKVGQKAEIRGFYQGTRFLVEEVNLKEIYEENPTITYDPNTCTIIETDGAKTYHVQKGQTAKVEVTNIEKIHYDWSILKQCRADENKFLEGAEFTLTAEVASVTYYGKSDATGVVKWYTDSAMTREANIQSFSDKAMTEKIENPIVAEGKYYLAETKAPNGYAIDDEVWTIVFSDVTSPAVYSGKIEGEIPSDAVEIENHLEIKTDEQGIQHMVTKFYYTNLMLYELPSTGGIGTYWYTLGGVVLMMSTSLMLYKKKREEVLGSR